MGKHSDAARTLGRKGGRSKSEAKRKAVTANLAKAREARRIKLESRLTNKTA